MAVQRSITRLTLAVLVPAAYFALVAWLLSRGTVEVYGFRVVPESRTAIEIALRAFPIIAALFLIFVSSWRHNVIGGLAQRRFAGRPAPYVLATVSISVFLAFVTTVLTAGAIAVASRAWPDIPGTTLLWLAIGFIVDLTLIGIFTIFLHALTRRTWLTLLLFVLYAAFVIVFGTKWHLTSFIGFASTVPVRLSSYAAMPLYFAGEWLFRAYWIAAAGVLLVILHRFQPLEKSIVAAMIDHDREKRRGSRRAIIAAVAVFLPLAIVLLQLQQNSLAKYRSVSMRRLERIGSANDLESRLRLRGYELALTYEPVRKTIRVSGAIALQNGPGTSLRVAYLQLPGVLTLEDVRLDGAGQHKLTRLRNYVYVEFPAPLPAGKNVRLLYSGVIHAANPFDLNVHDKVLPQAFFLTDSDLLIAPRRLSCFGAPPKGGSRRPAACESESYTLSDKATGTIRIVAPAGYTSVGPGTRTVAGTQSVFRVSPPQYNRFVIACARFATTIVPAAAGEPAIEVYRAKREPGALAEISRAAVAFYQQHWPRYGRPALTILETPAPSGEAVTFDSVVALSERIVQTHDPITGGTSNLAEFVLAHEIAHEWWGYQAVPTKAPGSLFVLESFPQFSAYKYLDHRKILDIDTARRNETKWYERARKSSKKAESPLASLQSSELALAYHKGTLTLLSLDQTTGGALMPAFGKVLSRHGCDTCPPAAPQEIVASLIYELPSPAQPNARALLFTVK
ncbi:MAG TPA: hypothetical protein VE974_00655 [Thermoanaerobaculia bacterium]|nr:hypothetical protein [Thermoanaerobaculia bacterium]